MRIAPGSFLFLLCIAAMLLIPGCCSTLSGGEETYACSYESRHTGCGGAGWSAWEDECMELKVDEYDYKSGWSPQKACGELSGSDTECGGSCCIRTEYRNSRLSSGGCP